MVKSKFHQAIEEMNKKREAVINQLGVFVESEAKVRTPVKTGHLRRSITHITEHTDTKSTAIIGSNVEYDPVVELGSVSKNIPAQPHYRPAIQQNKEQIKSIIEEGLKL